MDPEDNIQLPIIAVNMIITHILMSVHPQDTFSKKLDRLRKSTVQGNQLTRLSRYTSIGFLCDKKNLPANLQESWNHRETLSIKSRITAMMNNTMSTIHMILMSEHSSDSISNRLDRPENNTSQKKHITRLKDHNNIDQLSDKENLLTDFPESWSCKEPLHNRSGLINYGNCIIKAMYQYMQKEVYILSRPLKLQPMTNYSIASLLQLITQQDLPQLLSTLEAQEIYHHIHKEFYILSKPILAKQTLIQHWYNIDKIHLGKQLQS